MSALPRCFKTVHFLTAAIMSVIALSSCRGDGSESIVNGYDITFASSDAVYITYSGSSRPKTTVIDARVDGFSLLGTKIVVARKPTELQRDETGGLRYRVLPGCEYWEVDTLTHEVKKSEETAGLQCR